MIVGPEESKRYAEQLRRDQGINLQIRVGVNTGEVVLRAIRKDDLHTDYTPVGHSTHVAARMESLASGGAVVVSEGTYKLIAGYFECNALGKAKVKGVTEPIPIYEVLGVGPLRTRLQVAARHGLVRFVGRQSELEQMHKALEHATAGHGQIVGVVGEPGVGKSRLFYEFKLLAHRGCLVLETFSVSHSKAYPYLPLIDLLKHYCQITPQDDERQRREKITGRVLTLDRSLEDTLPYLLFLLGLTEPTSSLAQMDPQIRRRRTFEALKRVVVRESHDQQLFPALWGARNFYLMRAELPTARELTERLMLLAQRAQDSVLLMEAHHWLGQVLYFSGEVASARAHYEQAIVLFDPGQRRASIARYGTDLRVTGLSFLANVLWLLGYQDQARKRSREALTLAQEIDHPWNTAVVWLQNTVLHQFLRQAEAAQQQAQALITLCNEQGFSHLFRGTIQRGWALAEQGQEEEGIQQIHQGMAAVRATGTELFRPYYLALLAEAYGKTGQGEEGLTALAEALAAVDRTGERMYEAELYRLKGQLTLQKFGVRSSEFGVTNPQPLIPNPHAEAEACFLKAIEVARQQQAKSWELRATTSLARLWQHQGKKAEARKMLSDIYNWFAEGFDTKDLQDAKALLEELTGE